jgi:hypothetical protein
MTKSPASQRPATEDESETRSTYCVLLCLFVANRFRGENVSAHSREGARRLRSDSSVAGGSGKKRLPPSAFIPRRPCYARCPRRPRLDPHPNPLPEYRARGQSMDPRPHLREGRHRAGMTRKHADDELSLATTWRRYDSPGRSPG